MCTRLTSNVWRAMGRAWGQGTAHVAARDERANLVLPQGEGMSAGAPVYSSSDTTRTQHAFHLRAPSLRTTECYLWPSEPTLVCGFTRETQRGVGTLGTVADDRRVRSKLRVREDSAGQVLPPLMEECFERRGRSWIPVHWQQSLRAAHATCRMWWGGRGSCLNSVWEELGKTEPWVPSPKAGPLCSGRPDGL